MIFKNRSEAFTFLSDLSRGKRRATLRSVQAAGRTLGLPHRLTRSASGYSLSDSLAVCPYGTLAAASEAILWAFACAPVLPTEQARTLYRQTFSGHTVVWDEPGENF